MITSERIAEVLKSQEGNGISQVEISPKGYVYSQLENRIDASRPYTLTVHPIADERTLRISVSMIMSDSQDGPIPGVLANASISFGNKRLTVDTQKGIVFELNYVCQDDGDDAPLPEELGKLIDGMVRDFRQIEMLTLHMKGFIETFMEMVPSISQEFSILGL